MSPQEPFEEGLANGEELSAAEEAAALMAKEAKGGTVKFGWVKGVLVSVKKYIELMLFPFRLLNCLFSLFRCAAC